MTCERCQAEVSVTVTCEIRLKVGGNESVVRRFGACVQCADKVRPLLEEAIDSTILEQ